MICVHLQAMSYLRKGLPLNSSCLRPWLLPGLRTAWTTFSLMLRDCLNHQWSEDLHLIYYNFRTLVMDLQDRNMCWLWCLPVTTREGGKTYFHLLFFFFLSVNEWSQKQPLIFGIVCELWEQVNSVWLVNFKCTKTWKSGRSPNWNFIDFDKFT